MSILGKNRKLPWTDQIRTVRIRREGSNKELGTYLKLGRDLKAKHSREHLFATLVASACKELCKWIGKLGRIIELELKLYVKLVTR